MALVSGSSVRKKSPVKAVAGGENPFQLQKWLKGCIAAESLTLIYDTSMTAAASAMIEVSPLPSQNVYIHMADWKWLNILMMNFDLHSDKKFEKEIIKIT